MRRFVRCRPRPWTPRWGRDCRLRGANVPGDGFDDAQVQYLNDTTGTVSTFTVVNLGDTPFAAVDIARPSPTWTARRAPRRRPAGPQSARCGAAGSRVG